MQAPVQDGPSSSDPLSSPRRLASLAATRLMDTKAEEVFDRLTRLASTILDVPIAAVTLLDATRQFIKSGVGINVLGSNLVETSFCQHTVRTRAPFIVEDARTHPLTKNNPRAAAVQAYAGIPIASRGEALGAFCIADAKPRVWTERELAILADLGAAVESQIAAHVIAVESERRRELLETVLDTMGSGLIVADADRTIQIANAEARRIHGDQAIGAGPVSERATRVGLFRPDGKTHFTVDELPLLRAVRGDRVDDFEAVIRPPHRPDLVTHVTITARPLPTGGGMMIMRDTTSTHDLERKARRNEAAYHKLAGNIPNALVYLLDRDLKVLLAEGRLFSAIDFDPKELLGKHMSEISRAGNWETTRHALERALAGARGTFMVHREERCYEAHVEPVYEGSAITGVILIYFDVTQREREANQLRTITARHQALLEHMSEGVIFEDGDFHVQVVNRAALDMFGVRDSREMLGVDLSSPASISAPAARNSFAEPALASYEIDEKRRRGERLLGERIELADGRVVERDFLPVVDGGVHRGNLWIHRDITEKERNQQRIEEMSIRDELTGLYNRRGFIGRGERFLHSAQLADKTPILFFVDLNGMKQINDQMGHEEGDRALNDTARLLEKTFGPGDLIARLGGDEFVVLCPDPEGKEARLFESALRRNVTAFNDICTRVYRVSISIGATEFDPREPRTIEQMLNAADAQMYAAKRARQARGGVSIPPPNSKA